MTGVTKTISLIQEHELRARLMEAVHHLGNMCYIVTDPAQFSQQQYDEAVRFLREQGEDRL